MFYSLHAVFKNETPAAKRPGIFEESQELPMLIDRLTSSNVSPEVIRKLIRISRSCTGDKDALIWDHNFDHLLDSIYFVLEESSSVRD